MKKHHIKPLVVLNIFTSGQCIVAQMGLSMGLSYIFNSSIFVFSFFSGLYLMSMGFGVYLIEKPKLSQIKLKKLIIMNSLAGILLVHPGITALLFLNEENMLIYRKFHFELPGLIFCLGMLLTILIGTVSGAELPIFSKLFEDMGKKSYRSMTAILTSDYIGAFFGIIVLTYILYPFLGLIGSLLTSQVFTLAILIMIYLSITELHSKRLSIMIGLTMLWSIISWFFREDILEKLNSLSVMN